MGRKKPARAYGERACTRVCWGELRAYLFACENVRERDAVSLDFFTQSTESERRGSHVERRHTGIPLGMWMHSLAYTRWRAAPNYWCSAQRKQWGEEEYLRKQRCLLEGKNEIVTQTTRRLGNLRMDRANSWTSVSGKGSASWIISYCEETNDIQCKIKLVFLQSLPTSRHFS